METKTNTPNAYLKTKVMTASPEQLQLMLYDGAIRFCEQARTAIEEKNIEGSFKLLTKAQKIVLEMCAGMREEVDPDICANMRRLYMFSYDRLLVANIKKDIKALDEALKILREMRETWVLLIEKLQQERSAQQPEPVGAAAFSSDSFAPEIGANISFEG